MSKNVLFLIVLLKLRNDYFLVTSKLDLSNEKYIGRVGR